MKRFVLFSGLLASVFALPAFAEVMAGSAIPDRPANNVIMIFNTDPAEQCFRAAQDGVDLRFGLEHCNTAMRDPLTIYRAQTVVNRGIIRYDMGDLNGALNDFSNALDYNPSLGDAYLNQALVLVAQKRGPEALAAINQGITLGAANLQIAYYARGVIEDDAGHYAQAYRDYRQALRIKPGYQPAEREIARFKVVPRATQTQ
jgi:tetratricopeptide (TPR) repeat protein